MSAYIKLAEAPTLTINLPTCNACCVEVDADADGLICPCCGTLWGHRDGEDTRGQLYEEWSGEELAGDTITEDDAWRAGSAHEDAEREAASARFKAWDDKQKLIAEASADPEGQRLAAEAAALAGVWK